MLEDDLKPEEMQISFREIIDGLKKADPGLYEFAVHRLGPKDWQRMMTYLGEQMPETKRIIQANAKALVREDHPRHEACIDSGWEIARWLFANYDCALGFKDVPEEKFTVTVHLNIDRPVLGLPKPIISLSNDLIRDYGGLRKWTFGFDNRVFVSDLSLDAILSMQKDPFVQNVIIEPMARIMSNETPVYNPNAVNTDWGVSRVHPESAWTKGLKGEGVKVAVLDTGIQKNHIAFWAGGITNYKGGYNFVGGTDNPEDDHDHGTFCCGVVAHRHTGVNGHYKGIAPNIDLYACKVLDSKGSGSYANIAAAIDWARTHGMDIISMSLGGASGTTTLQAACDAAWYAGVLLVAAAGNSGPEDNTVSYPAKYASVMAIAAIDYGEAVAGFSARGPEVELAAPGVYIVGPWAGFTYDNYVVAGSGNKYMCASGTSAACPHVSGCAAVIKNWYPAANNMYLRQWLREHCRDW